MFLVRDMTAGLILLAVKAPTLLRRDNTVGLRGRFVAGDAVLLALQFGRFACGQFPRGDALVDALLLVGLTLVDLRRGRRGLGKGGSTGGQQRGGDDETGKMHEELLVVGGDQGHAGEAAHWAHHHNAPPGVCGHIDCAKVGKQMFPPRGVTGTMRA